MFGVKFMGLEQPDHWIVSLEGDCSRRLLHHPQNQAKPASRRRKIPTALDFTQYCSFCSIQLVQWLLSIPDLSLLFFSQFL
jgi:hypothetical protein